MNYEPITTTATNTAGDEDDSSGSGGFSTVHYTIPAAVVLGEDDDAVVVEATPGTPAPVRRPKGVLEKQVREVLDAYVTHEIDFDGKPVTPHRIAAAIEERFPAMPKPTSGAVAAVFTRWENIGAATFGSKPQQFIGYTVEASELGFTELYARYKAR